MPKVDSPLPGRIHTQVEDEVPSTGSKMSCRKRNAAEAQAGGTMMWMKDELSNYKCFSNSPVNSTRLEELP